MGDRFAHQGKAQLQAVLNAQESGIDIYPVWNKSFREHSIVCLLYTSDAADE